jgi:site-specific recombinase XerD
MDIEGVRDFLGHQHLESTQIYTRVNQNQLKI